MRIDDNGIVRDMTPEEETTYLAQMAELESAQADEEPTPEDYEAAMAKLGVE